MGAVENKILVLDEKLDFKFELKILIVKNIYLSQETINKENFKNNGEILFVFNRIGIKENKSIEILFKIIIKLMGIEPIFLKRKFNVLPLDDSSN